MKLGRGVKLAGQLSREKPAPYGFVTFDPDIKWQAMLAVGREPLYIASGDGFPKRFTPCGQLPNLETSPTLDRGRLQCDWCQAA